MSMLGVCAQAQEETWIISGQSNACGRAALPGPNPDPKVQMFNGKQWVTAQEPLPSLNGSVGPWHAAALEVAAKGNLILRLMGYAEGGQPIKYWDEGQQGYTALAANIKQCGLGGGVFLWFQGESDAIGGMDISTYQAKLKDLVSRVRTVAKNPAMLAVIVQIGAYPGGPGDEKYMAIREAQRQFVIADGNALLLPAIGRAGDLHLTKEGYFELGKEIGRALLKVHYKQKDVNWPGPVLDAAVLAPDGKTAFAHFAEVKKLEGCEAADFGAGDAEGLVKCVKVVTENTRVALTLERAVRLPANLIYGFGQNPKATLVNEAGNRAPAVQLPLAPGAVPQDKPTAAPNGAGPVNAGKK